MSRRFTFTRPGKHWRRLNDRRFALINKEFDVGLTRRETLKMATITSRMDWMAAAERDRIYGPEVAAAVRQAKS